MGESDPAGAQELHEAAERLDDLGHEEYAEKLRARAAVRMSRTRTGFAYLKSALMWFVTIAAIGLGTGGTFILAYNQNIVGAVAVLFVCLVILTIVFVLSVSYDAIYDAVREERRDELP